MAWGGRRGWNGGLALALAFACACGTFSSHRPRHRLTESGWLELTSEHFVLHTDLEPKKARALSLELERLLLAYLQLGWRAKGDVPLKLNVVVFADKAEFLEFAPPQLLGYYLPEAMFEPWVVIGSASEQYELDVLKHELNHSIAYHAIQNQPRWFAEGIAMFFETAYFARNGWFVVGSPPQQYIPVLQSFGILHPAMFRRDNDNRSMHFEMRFYASSWLLVHYLMTQRSEGFRQFQSRLARGEHSDEAWAAAFPDLTDDRLNVLLNDYFARGNFKAYTMLVRATVPPTRERAMTEADVHALRALLYVKCPGCGDRGNRRAKEEFALALEEDPRHERAGVLRVLAEPSDAGRRKAARDFTAAHPNSWVAWVTLAVVEMQGNRAGGAEALAAAERVAALAPRQPYALMLLAAHAAASGRNDEALELSRRALRLQPTSPKLLELQYKVLVILGRCQELPAVLVTLGNVTHKAPAELERDMPKCLPAPQLAVDH